MSNTVPRGGDGLFTLVVILSAWVTVKASAPIFPEPMVVVFTVLVVASLGLAWPVKTKIPLRDMDSDKDT